MEKESAFQEMQVSTLGWEDPLDGNENSVQYSCLGNPMDRGAWRAAVHVVTKSQITQLSINNNKPDKAISSVQLLSHV